MKNELVKFTDKGTIQIRYELDIESPEDLGDILADISQGLFVQYFGKDEMEQGFVPELSMIDAFRKISDVQAEVTTTLEEHLQWLLECLRSEKH